MLRDPADVAAPLLDPARGQVDAAHAYAPGGRGDQAEQQGAHGAFAGAAGAHQRHGLARLEFQIRPVEHHPGTRRVGERHLFDNDGSVSRARDLASAAARRSVLCIEEVEHALGDSATVCARMELRTEAAKREIELGSEHEHRQSGLEPEAPIHEAHSGGNGHQRDAQRRGKLEHRAREEADPQRLHRRCAVALAHLGQDPGLCLGTAEGPERRQPAHDVQEVQREHVQRLPPLNGALLRVAPDQPHEHGDKRKRDQHDQRRLDVLESRAADHDRWDDAGQHDLGQVAREVRLQALDPLHRGRRDLGTAGAVGRPQRWARRRFSASASRSSDSTSHAARRPAISIPQAHRPRARKAAASAAIKGQSRLTAVPCTDSVTTRANSAACARTASAVDHPERHIDCEQRTHRPRPLHQAWIKAAHQVSCPVCDRS